MGVPVPVRRPASRRGSARSPRAPGCRRWRASPTRLEPPGRRAPDRGRGLGIFQTPRRRACACRPTTAPTTCSTPALPDLQILNGFIQSLVGLYDFAQLTGDADGAGAVPRGRRCGAQGGADASTPAPGRCTRAARSTHESDLGYHKLLRDFLAQLCTRTGDDVVLQHRAALHPVPDDAAGVAVLHRARCARARPASCASGCRRSRGSSVTVVARGRQGRHARPRVVLGRGTTRWAGGRRSKPGDYTVTRRRHRPGGQRGRRRPARSRSEAQEAAP